MLLVAGQMDPLLSDVFFWYQRQDLLSLQAVVQGFGSRLQGLCGDTFIPGLSFLLALQRHLQPSPVFPISISHVLTLRHLCYTEKPLLVGCELRVIQTGALTPVFNADSKPESKTIVSRI